MRIATIHDLIAADDQRNFEVPPGFDWNSAMQEVGALRELLSKRTGLAFAQNMHVQDATLFSELHVNEPPINNVIYSAVTVQFSAFARFFTVWGNSSVHPLTDELRQGIIELACADDFIFVPSELLDQPYGDPNLFENWGVRFFGWM
jgi:hypothetical protein